MKKLKIIMMFLLMLAAIPISGAFAYSGGLLNGKIMQAGPDVGVTNTTITLATDNDLSTGYTMGYINTSQDTLWYNFSDPVDITQYQFKATDVSASYYIEMYNSSGVLVNQAIPVVNGVKTTYVPQSSIKSIAIVNLTSKSLIVYEFDVFGSIAPTATPTATPSPTVSPVPTATPVSSPSATPIPTPTVTPIATPSPTPSATPEQTGDRALLTITLINGTEKEYDLPMAEVNAFLNWYDARDAGRGTGLYAIDKHTNNKGPFGKRKDYVIFDRILTFEVSEYTTE